MAKSAPLKVCYFIAAVLCWLFFTRWLLGLTVLNRVLGVKIFNLFMALGVAAIFAAFTVKVDRSSLKESVLFMRRSFIKTFGQGVLFGTGMFAIVIFLLRSTNAVEISLRTITPSAMCVNVALLLFGTLCGAFWEELAFRGYVLNTLFKQYGMDKSCIMVGIIFGGLHSLSLTSSALVMMATFFSGALLSYAFMLAGDLSFPIGIHFAWNAWTSFFSSKVFVELGIKNHFLAGASTYDEGLFAIAVTALGAILLAYKSRMMLVRHENGHHHLISD